MRSQFAATGSVIALAMAASPAFAQDTTGSDAESRAAQEAPTATDNRGDVIIVTATRREADLQDVPLSVSAFQQEELTEKGIVGYERLARETPGVVLNRPTRVSPTRLSAPMFAGPIGPTCSKTKKSRHPQPMATSGRHSTSSVARQTSSGALRCAGPTLSSTMDAGAQRGRASQGATKTKRARSER